MDQSYQWLATGMMNPALTSGALSFATPPLSRWGSFSSQHPGTPALSVCESISEDFSLSSAESSPRPGMAQWSYAGNESNENKSALEKFGFKLNLLGDKKTRDGQAPKRRGPKPDSKPALTRRQELNRQAQRTHRERKEMYIKALEQEVLRLKELYQSQTKEKESHAEENRRLKELLGVHGIQFESASPNNTYLSTASPFGDSSTTSLAGRGSISTGYTSPPSRGPQPSVGPALMKSENFDQMSGRFIDHQFQSVPQVQTGLDYDQFGREFVLALEWVCDDHMQMLSIKSRDSDGEISGHAMMATCPPNKHLDHSPDEKYPHKMPELPSGDLANFLKSSYQLGPAFLSADTEITPIMAWAGIFGHPRRKELTADDFQTLQNDLKSKVRCYGFGAVLEDFEVRDALMKILAAKPDCNAAGDFEELYGLSPEQYFSGAWHTETEGQPWSPVLTQAPEQHAMATLLST